VKIIFVMKEKDAKKRMRRVVQVVLRQRNEKEEKLKRKKDLRTTWALERKWDVFGGFVTLFL
jgi:hypothetical protein